MNFVLLTSKCSMRDGKCIPVQLVINKCFYSRIITGGNIENRVPGNLFKYLNIQSDFFIQFTFLKVWKVTGGSMFAKDHRDVLKMSSLKGSEICNAGTNTWLGPI